MTPKCGLESRKKCNLKKNNKKKSVKKCFLKRKFFFSSLCDVQFHVGNITKMSQDLFNVSIIIVIGIYLCMLIKIITVYLEYYYTNLPNRLVI